LLARRRYEGERFAPLDKPAVAFCAERIAALFGTLKVCNTAAQGNALGVNGVDHS
jgi:hypothetical protein